jgi:NAD(P)-dependent dehydrogenase (short-subunit alcohol dehydrogenase family)
MKAKHQKPQVVVITGASAGVGRATARKFARRGAHLALVARGRDGLEGTRREVEALGGRALVFTADVADAAALERVAAETEATLGPIDVWINNAMASVFSPVRQMEPEEYRRVTEVTYLGQVYGTLAALRRMLPRDRGSIVFVGSALAYRGIPLQSAYCGAKHAVEGFFDSLRAELLHDKSNVRVTMVQLPALNTPQFDWVKSRLPRKGRPMGKVFQPEVAADAICFASRRNRREVFVGAPTVQAILGDKLVPELGDWLLARQGYAGQQTGEPEDPNRPHNLWEPLPGDRGAHGRFDGEAASFSPQLWATKHKPWVLAATALLTAGAAWLVNRRRTQPDGQAPRTAAAQPAGPSPDAEETKDRMYTSRRTYPDASAALQAFAWAEEKLFDVNAWSDLPGITAKFALHDAAGMGKTTTPQIGDYIRIDLPGPFPENWVRVTSVRVGDTAAEFTVQPSGDPGEEVPGETEHFFRKEARSTFRVQLQGNTLIASEIGRHESINNEGQEAGNRALVNTVIAKGGWALGQQMQWQKLTDYLVHLEA